MRPPSPSRNDDRRRLRPGHPPDGRPRSPRARWSCRRAPAGAPSPCPRAARCGCGRCAAPGSRSDQGLEPLDHAVRLGERELARQLHVQRQLVALGQVHHAHVVDLAHLGHARRGRRGQLAQVAGRLARLDVDDHVGARQRLLAPRARRRRRSRAPASRPRRRARRPPGRRSGGRRPGARGCGAAPGARSSLASSAADAVARPRAPCGPSARRRTAAPGAAPAATTRAATNSAATASAEGSPAATKIIPISTATEPARSEAKWRALAANAGEGKRRAARRLATRPRGVQRDHHRQHRERPPGRLDAVALAVDQPPQRLGRDRDRHQDQERALRRARPGARPCRGRTGGRGRAGGSPPAPRTA